jgi:hypothetical protein
VGLLLWAAVAAAPPAATGPGGPTPTATLPPTPLDPALAETQPNRFFEAPRFHQGLREAEARPAPRGAGLLVGGLTSHHALAGVVISQLFVELGEHPPHTVIVVGPNHENRGQRIITGRRAWATDFGPVPADQDLVTKLVKAGLAEADDSALAPEHAVGALMPYLKFHAPDAKVVPLILHREVSPAEVRRLARFLAPLLGPDVVLIASVDFSHYLTRREAEANDELTMQAIASFDLDALWRMGPDYLDSPASLGLLMLTMQELGATGPETAAHTNSGELIGSGLIETTSYFTFKYRLTAGAGE